MALMLEMTARSRSYRVGEVCDIFMEAVRRNSELKLARPGFEMSRSTWIKSALSGAFIASAMCAATPALALEAKQCATRAEIVQALQDEGQVEVINAQRTALGGPKNIFTTNSTLSLGYNLEAGVGAETGKICVAMKYTKIRLNGDAELRRPTWASFGPNTPHDIYLTKMEVQDNDKVLLGATTLVRASDGSEQNGPFLMVTRGNPAPGANFRNAGVATATSSKGGIAMLLSMANVETNSNFRTLARSHPVP